METKIHFQSDGLTLAGILHVPDDVKPGEKRPAIMVLHGFGANMAGKPHETEARLYCSLGYIALRFDFRGCGESEGERGRIICLEQVEDTKHAFDWLAQHSQVDAARIAVAGQSFGGAVAVYTGGVDPRMAAVISVGGWGDGEAKFRGQHKAPEAWARFTQMLDEGKRHKAQTGTSLMVPRWDIVPIPEHLRKHVPPGAIMEFPVETAQSMFDFRANEVVPDIAPRPFLLVHATHDSVTPSSQSLEMFKRAGRGAELMMLDRIDHFPFADGSRLPFLLKNWLETYFPLGG